MTMNRIPTAGAGTVNLRILVVAPDESVVDECRAALAMLPDRRAVVYFTSSLREAVDIVRNRQPQFVIAELSYTADEIADLSRDLHEVAPHVQVAAAYHSNQLSDDGGDSTAIIDLLRAEVRDFLRRPVSPVELGDVLDRLFSTRPPLSSTKLGRVVSFVSNKGGVGKSTVSVNVACALAKRHPGEVLLIDASLQLGICALMLGLTPAATMSDAARERDRLDEALLRGLTTPHPSGLRLLAAPADALEASDIGDQAIARLLHVARRSFDYIVVDTFPMLDSVVMAALDASDLIFVVLQGIAPSVAGVGRLLPVLEGLGFESERQRIVLNRNHKRFLGDLTTADVEGRLGRRVDHVVPYERGVLVSMNTGEPQMLRTSRWSSFARTVNAIADAVDQLEVTDRAPIADAAGDLRSRLDADQRSGRDRRVKDVGYIGGERRSGSDRRRSRDANVADGIQAEVTR
jgi:pilus assembly protein CpaE